MRNSIDSQRNKETKWYNLKQSSDNSSVWDKKIIDKSCKLCERNREINKDKEIERKRKDRERERQRKR